ncbi:MAG TPA: single-stranded-DNA-specific exonuclease RecJ [Candidatus Kerfeldbacteria bacterium]|nr:single-stranded-DNA-specific exonuclease RecJ [Candidatus Kerfeldbacteria bacterium]
MVYFGYTMQKKWVIADPISKEFRNKFPEIHPVILQLLHNRGMRTQEQIDEFMNPDWGEDIHDPFLFRDMRKAVDRIRLAIWKGESIVVYGDYDADGVSASAILFEALTALGAKDVHVHLPHRETEGYGLNIPAVKELIKRKANVIITCDCGTSNWEEVAVASKAGIDVIVTDHHHEPNQMPTPFAFLNPQLSKETYPFKHLAGGGVAFKLIQGLAAEDRKKEKKLSEGFEKWLLDLVAISTVTDMMPLVGENRTLVHYGLVVLRKTKRIGLQALMKTARGRLEDIDTHTIGFQIGPRLNAAGRMDHANTAFELLIERSSEVAAEIAEKLDTKNRERQRLSETMVKEAEKQLVGSDERILIVQGKEWPVGVIGLVAGRLSDRYHRPAFALGEKGNDIVGSGRSVPSFDITGALAANSDLFSRYGGHTQACGFTMPKKHLKAFHAAFKKLGRKIPSKDLIPTEYADAEIGLDDVNWKLYEVAEKFEPFGENNPFPRFVARGVEIVECQKVGKYGKHLRLQVRHASDLVRKVIAFGFSGHEALTAGAKFDMMFEVSVNEWNGNRELQLKLVDARKATHS